MDIASPSKLPIIHTKFFVFIAIGAVVEIVLLYLFFSLGHIYHGNLWMPFSSVATTITPTQHNNCHIIAASTQQTNEIPLSTIAITSCTFLPQNSSSLGKEFSLGIMNASNNYTVTGITYTFVIRTSKNGKILTTVTSTPDEVIPTISSLTPSQAATQNVSIDAPVDNIQKDWIEVTVSGLQGVNTDSGSFNTKDVVVSNITFGGLYASPNQYKYTISLLNNNSEKAVTNLNLQFSYKDAKGNVIDTETGIIKNDIYPNTHNSKGDIVINPNTQTSIEVIVTLPHEVTPDTMTPDVTIASADSTVAM